MTVPVNVGGVTGQYEFDVTSSTAQEEFQQAVDQIVTVSQETGTPSDTDLATFNSALNNLKLLAQGVDPVTLVPLTTPITANMANVVNSLLSFVSALNPGVTLDNTQGLGSTSQLGVWNDVYYQGMQGVLSSYSSVNATSTMTLQSYVNLDYIDSGNQLMYAQMDSLQQAMQQTNSVLQLLDTAQGLKNQVTVAAPGYTAGNYLSQSGFARANLDSAKINPGCVTQNYVSNTSSLGKRLLISVDPTFLQDLYTQGAALKTQLTSAITSLNQISPAGQNDPNSLQSALQQVLTDMGSGNNGLVNWLLDNEEETVPAGLPNAGSALQVSLAGNYQRNLTNATTTAENLNASQNVTLKTTFFDFQEFYSSASSVLSSIDNIVTTMGQNTKT